MINSYKKNSFSFVIFGIVLLVIAGLMLKNNSQSLWVVILFISGHIFFSAGFYFYVRGKGYSNISSLLFAMLGLLNIIGLIIIELLPDKNKKINNEINDNDSLKNSSNGKSSNIFFQTKGLWYFILFLFVIGFFTVMVQYLKNENILNNSKIKIDNNTMVTSKDNLAEKNKENDNQKYKFNINLDSLPYELPAYTKICSPSTRFDCTGDGCTKENPSVFVLYNEEINKVYRCDKNPCDGYDILREESGLYTNLTPVIPNGALVKISDNNEYAEFVSLGLDSIIYRGKCVDKK